MRRLSGRPGHEYDENWLCEQAILERRNGGLGPFKHLGEARIPVYILRSEENEKAVSEEQQAFMVEYQLARETGKPVEKQPALGAWTDPRPGDALIDRDLKRVYWVAPDGSRRRVHDHNACQLAINRVKEQLERIRLMREEQLAKEKARADAPKIVVPILGKPDATNLSGQ